MLKTVSNGQSIHQYIPPDLRRMFYKNPAHPLAISNGLDPHGWDVSGLRLYVPFWALRGSAFKSVDAYETTCAVTGTVLGDTGATFDASDDTCSLAAPVSCANLFAGGGTAAAWINAGSDGEDDFGRIFYKLGTAKGWFLCCGYQDNGNIKLRFDCNFDVANGQWALTAADIAINTPTFVAVTYDSDNVANNPIIYVGTTAKTVGSGITELAPPSNSAGDDTTTNLYIGEQGTGAATFDGTIGEGWLFKGIKTAGQLADLRSRTIWRHS